MGFEQEDYDINNDPWGVNNKADNFYEEKVWSATDFAQTDCRDVIPIGPVKTHTRKSKINREQDINTEFSTDNNAIISFVLGILSLTCGFHICAIISLVLGSSSLQKGKNPFALAGVICSGVSLALLAIALFIFSTIIANLSNFTTILSDIMSSF